jgi:hypothetical protein
MRTGFLVLVLITAATVARSQVSIQVDGQCKTRSVAVQVEDTSSPLLIELQADRRDNGGKEVGAKLKGFRIHEDTLGSGPVESQGALVGRTLLIR